MICPICKQKVNLLWITDNNEMCFNCIIVPSDIAQEEQYQKKLAAELNKSVDSLDESITNWN